MMFSCCSTELVFDSNNITTSVYVPCAIFCGGGEYVRYSIYGTFFHPLQRLYLAPRSADHKTNAEERGAHYFNKQIIGFVTMVLSKEEERTAHALAQAEAVFDAVAKGAPKDDCDEEPDDDGAVVDNEDGSGDDDLSQESLIKEEKAWVDPWVEEKFDDFAKGSNQIATTDFPKLLEALEPTYGAPTYCEETIKKISSVEDSSSDKVITRKAFLDWYTDWLCGGEPTTASVQGVGEPLVPINLFHALASQAASQAKYDAIVDKLTESLFVERDKRLELKNQVEELKTVVHEMKSKIELLTLTSQE